MATEVYTTGYVSTIRGDEIYITPLKLIYMREFMEAFEHVRNATGDEEALTHLTNCIRITMKQYAPHIVTTYDVEDNFDMKTVYKILELATGITMKQDEDKTVSQNAKESNNSWKELDLAKLESEAFLLGIWKDYEELERSISMTELTAILEAKRESDYSMRKFMAAIQGVDLDKETGRGEENAWERLKAKVFSGGKTTDPNDITAYQGAAATKAGFGIGMGLGYEDLR